MKRLAVLLGAAILVPGLLGVGSAANPPLAGNLDPSFGSGGVVTHSLGSGESPTVGGIAVQPDGKIVVAGGSPPGDHGLLLARYLPSGEPDPNFGNGGYVETQVGDWAFAKAVVLQPDGKIVVAGVSYQGDPTVLSEFTLARYNANGSLDTTFGASGITNTVIPAQPPGTGEEAVETALAILPGGKIVAGGSVGGVDAFEPNARFALAEYKPDGSLDPTFGNGGIVQTGFTGDDSLGGIAIQPGGKIVATGYGLGGAHGQGVDTMVLARYQPDGSLDPTFGTAGKVVTRPKLHYGGGPPTLQHGKIVVAGYHHTPAGNFIPAIARYKANGRLDSTFGKNGFAEIERLIGSGWPPAVLAQNDGRILIAVNGDDAGPSAVARLLPNGRLDPSFGGGGIVFSLGFGVALAAQTDGKILVGGGSGGRWTLSRLIGGNNCVVPRLRGTTVSKASATLTNSYCRRGRISKHFSSKVTRGRVISTAPPRGARLPSGAKVDLVVSKGTRP